MKSNFKKLIIAATALSTATLSFAQLTRPIIAETAGGGTAGSGIGANLQNVVLAFKNISTGVYSSLFVVALIAFAYGIIKAMVSSDPNAKKDGLKSIGFGAVALFAMVGIWGIVSFLSSNLGIGVGGDIPTPGVPYTTGLR